MNKDNAADWIARAGELPQKKLEREVVEHFPDKAPHFDRAQMMPGNQVQLQITVSEETAELLKRVQDLLCEKKQSHATNAESLNTALKFFLEKNDPVAKADRSKKSVGNVSRDTLKRRPLPRAVLHAVNRRDRRTCTGCGSRRYLHIHHKKPISEGGQDSPENLTTLCGPCHRLEH